MNIEYTRLNFSVWIYRIKIMENLLEYESFYKSNKEGLHFRRHNLSPKYEDRAKAYGIDIPGNSLFSKVYGFLDGFESYLDRFGEKFSSEMERRRAERGGGPDTGIEALLKLPSVVPGVLKRIFGPSIVKYKGADEDETSLELMRHTNDVYIKNDLPNIRTQRDLTKNLSEMYKKAGYKWGQNPVLDEIARNRTALYFSRNKTEAPMRKEYFQSIPEMY